MKNTLPILPFGLVLALAPVQPLAAQTAKPASTAAPASTVDKMLDRVVAGESVFLERMKQRTPLVETYIQETSMAESGDARPDKDHYFLGRFHNGDTLTYEKLVEHTDAAKPASKRSFLRGGPKGPPLTFLPRGFAQMAFIDTHDFNRRTYRFDYFGR